MDVKNKCFSVRNESAGGLFPLFHFVSILKAFVGKICWTLTSAQGVCLGFMPIT